MPPAISAVPPVTVEPAEMVNALPTTVFAVAAMSKVLAAVLSHWRLAFIATLAAS